MKQLLLALLLTLSFTAHALEDRVVAVVNSNIITEGQVMARTGLRIRQLGVTNASEAQTNQLAKRTLGDMIDEELQHQYADKIGMNITDDMVKKALREVQANTPAFTGLNTSQLESLKEQIRGEIRWASITANVVKPQIEISNGETDQIIADMTKSRHVLEREISQIFVAVDETNEPAARARMDGILKKLKTGESFETLARTESEDQASASAGGLMGWFASGELNPQLEEALGKLEPKQLSGLIRTPLGFHIIRLENVRTTKPLETGTITEANITIIARPLAVSETENTAAALLAETTAPLRKQFELEAKLADPAFQSAWPASKTLGWINTANLQPALQQIAANQKPGTWSQPFTMNGNITAMYIAETRQATSPQLIAYRERVKNHLMQNRLELASRRLMRDLRAKAFVDIRW